MKRRRKMHRKLGETFAGQCYEGEQGWEPHLPLTTMRRMELSAIFILVSICNGDRHKTNTPGCRSAMKITPMSQLSRSKPNLPTQKLFPRRNERDPKGEKVSESHEKLQSVATVHL
mmetsp:Transcript_493/g.890  ORF Transcript_493/g.890 Transcript_493/m.890 type:complete len:116 (-) Transcript_493:2022-2369(-)